jgi:transposase-like protein
VSKERRRFTREFKLAALARFAEASNVQDLARELGIERALLYKWQAKFEAGGADALTTTGRPRPTVTLRVEAGGAPAPPDDLGRAQRRIAELERKVGQQQVELDFFRAALRQVEGRRRRNGGPGDPTSSR